MSEIKEKCSQNPQIDDLLAEIKKEFADLIEDEISIFQFMSFVRKKIKFLLTTKLN